MSMVTIKTYFIKLINGEKLETNEENFNQWLYNTGDDHIICFGKSGTMIFVKKKTILLAYIKQQSIPCDDCECGEIDEILESEM